MSDHIFRNQQSSDFWEECKAEIPTPYSEIVLEILRTLDVLGRTASVRSEYPSRGEYAFQGKTSLLDHSIHVARICLSHSELSITRNLAVTPRNYLRYGTLMGQLGQRGPHPTTKGNKA